MKKLLFCLMFFPALAWAIGRNINGVSGYIMMPNAEGLRYKQYDLGLSSFSGNDVTDAHWKYNMGLGTAEGTEFSFMGRSEREGLFLSAKWFGMLNNYDNPIYVALGFENLSSMGTFQDYPSMYMVMTKKFTGGHSVSLGSVGRYVDKGVVASLMTGFEMYTDDTLSWLMDCVAYENNQYNLNAGIRIYTSSNVYFNFMLVNVIHSGAKILDDDDEEIDAHPFFGMIGMTITNFL